MKPGKVIYWTAFSVLLLVFVSSSIPAIVYMIQSMQQGTIYEDLASLREDGRKEPTVQTIPVSEPIGDPTGPDDPTEPVIKPILPEYEALLEINPDLIGWLYIEGTNVNYPVVQNAQMPDYYLKHNFNREFSSHGCPFASELCDVEEPSDNVVIYGHHMNDGQMFAELERYLYQEYWQDHELIQFDTLRERRTYRVFAVFRTSGTTGAGFAYHQFVDAEDEADFYSFVGTCKMLSAYETGIMPEYGDKILCLSTCEYSQSNGRLVVAAVLVPEKTG